MAYELACHTYATSWDQSDYKVWPIFPNPSFPQRSESALNQSPRCASALLPHQIWSPPSYATSQILHGLPLVTMGTQHLSARTKLKCNSHFTIIVIVSMRHSLTFLQKLLLFFSLFICQPVITLFCMAILFFLFDLLIFCWCVCHWNSRRTLDQSRVSVAPVSVLCWCVWSFLLLLSWLENIGHLFSEVHSLSSPSVTTKT